MLLRKDGYYVSRKTVQKYMRQMAIYPIYPGPNLSKRNYKEGILPYLLRGYVIQFLNQVWKMADIDGMDMLGYLKGAGMEGQTRSGKESPCPPVYRKRTIILCTVQRAQL